MNKRPILIIDGMNIFLRNLLVNETMSAFSEPVGGIVGFLKHIDILMKKFAPSQIIVVWENGGGCPRRKAIYPEYKANRAKMFKSGTTIKDKLRNDTDTRIKQLNILYNLLKHTPICQIFIKETECDDIIGYLIKNHFYTDDSTKIIDSGDKDFYQLLEDESVRIYDPARKILIDKAYVLKTYNISPRNFCLAKTFNGDDSDNITGVPGVGFKTLTKWYPIFSNETIDLTVDDILTETTKLLESNKKSKTLKEIFENKELLKRNWKLMYLNSSNLSASQIEKVNGTLEMHEYKMDKLSLLKDITKAGINISFDFDDFSLSLKKFLIFSR